MNEIEEKKQKAILNVQLIHKDDVTKLKRQNKYLKKKHEDFVSKMESKDLSFFVNRTLKGMHFEKRASVVLDLVVCGTLFGEKVKKASKKIIWREVKKTFRAWKLCMAKDTADQGCLNLQGIEAVRKVEDLEEQEEGILPSKSPYGERVMRSSRK